LGNRVPQLPFAFLRRGSHRLFLQLVDRTTRAGVEELRRELGLRPLDRSVIEDDFASRVGTLGLWSESVLPAPHDWPDNFRITGYCFLPPHMRARLNETTPQRLEEWLSAGSPPIFFGFGSMPVLDPKRMFEDVQRVARRLGARALIGAGWTSYKHDGDEDVFVAGAFDHDAVLPRCRAAVHHGGAGTTAAALRAGIPAVVCSVFGDQPFWGWHLTRLGVGTTLPFQRVNATRLEEALRRVLRSDTNARAAALGARLRAEDGLVRTADVIEREFGHRSQGAAVVGVDSLSCVGRATLAQ
jgi:sterol 3beta-glucosyltransferase